MAREFTKDMKLIITRHGEAESGMDDFNRNLTQRGRADIARMCRILRTTGWNITSVRHSPLVRARQTAEIIAGELRNMDATLAPPVEERRIAPGFGIDEAGEALVDTHGSDAAVWVFHAPDVSRLAAALTGMPESGFYFTPGTMAAFNLPSASAFGRGMLVWIMQPDYLPVD